MNNNYYQAYNQDIPLNSQPYRNSSKNNNKVSIPYVLPYIILLMFNGLLYGVNYIYSDLQNGAWSPPLFAVQPQLLKQRPYQITVYVLNSVSTLIFFVYMMYPGHQSKIRSEKAMIARWFLHLIAISLIIIIWILDASHLWVYKISLNDIAFNSNWSEPLFTILYGVTVAYGLLLAFPTSVYLLYRYFIKAEDNYKSNPELVEYNKFYNKICYYATYISIIIVLSLNLAYLSDYETYIVNVIFPNYPFYPNLQIEMLLPVLYVEYIFSGTALLLGGFLLLKETFDTMKDKRKHIRRQLIVLTSAMFLIDLLSINRFIQVNRYQKVISQTKKQPFQDFLDLYYHLRVVMWCYLFLLFPLNIYSIRNLWIQWKNEFSSGNLSELRFTQYPVSKEEVRMGKQRQILNSAPRQNHQYQEDRRYPSEEKRYQPPQQRQPTQNNERYSPNQEYVVPIRENQAEIRIVVPPKPESHIQVDLRS